MEKESSCGDRARDKLKIGLEERKTDRSEKACGGKKFKGASSAHTSQTELQRRQKELSVGGERRAMGRHQVTPLTKKGAKT